jgi:NADPH:quinone reductase-like Zn-dependent oxidoreductase
MDIRKPVVGAAPSVLIIGGAGGVSSIAIQLVHALTDLTVVATASPVMAPSTTIGAATCSAIGLP